MAMTAEERKRTAKSLRNRGFKVSTDRETGYLRVKCDQCQSMIINGVATHEAGCPNKMNRR